MAPHSTHHSFLSVKRREEKKIQKKINKKLDVVEFYYVRNMHCTRILKYETQNQQKKLVLNSQKVVFECDIRTNCACLFE